MPVEIVILWVTPALAFWAAFRVPGLARRVRQQWGRRRHRDLAVRPPERQWLQAFPLERIVSDLTRLAADLDRVHATHDLPGRALRLRAFTWAYDDTLVCACRSLGVEAPARPPLSAVDRLQVEAALAQQGLRW